jgi:hypothetical protein
MGTEDAVPVGTGDEARRREMFDALVAAEAGEGGVRACRAAVAAQFGVDVEAVEEVEDEGLDMDWPPFGKG